jgi:hypothetical protein
MTCVAGGQAVINGACRAPVIATFAPTSGPTGTAVTIDGTFLGGATSVKFNGVNASGFTIASCTQIVAVAPHGAVGTISVTTACGTGESSTPFTPTDVVENRPFNPVRVWPNPFSGRVQIGFTIPTAQTVRLDIFDVTGRKVRSLPTVRASPGGSQFVWDGRGPGGRQQPAGIYLVRVRWPGFEATRWVTKVD